MKNPVIEVRERTVTVTPEFSGHLEGPHVHTRANLAGNLLRYLIDSSGELWSLEYAGSNRNGLRGAFSALLWNISSDTYRATRRAASVEEYRRVLEPYLAASNPDDQELAAALLEPLASVPGDEPLSRHVELLNL